VVLRFRGLTWDIRAKAITMGRHSTIRGERKIRVRGDMMGFASLNPSYVDHVNPSALRMKRHLR